MKAGKSRLTRGRMAAVLSPAVRLSFLIHGRLSSAFLEMRDSSSIVGTPRGANCYQ
jgi:hypothetical protein